MRSLFLKFFVSLAWNMIAAWIVFGIASSIATAGGGSAIAMVGAILTLNLLLAIMASLAIDATFNVLREWQA